MSICQYVSMSVCRYVKMSIFQNANFQLRYQKKSCSECQNDVRKHYVGMSTCRYVNMSVCQYGRMQLLSLGIKRKVGQNVNRMSDSQYVNVRRLLFSLGIKMKVVPNVIRMSMSIYHDVRWSENKSEKFYGQLKSPLLFQKKSWPKMSQKD